LRCLAIAVALVALARASLAQETRYIYDPLGRLVGVAEPQGQFTIYDYDEVGNLLAVRRPDTTAPVAITFVNPAAGPAGTQVEVFGAGFSTVSTANQISFNGVSSQVLSASATRLVTQVPIGATSGPINVTTPLGSAASPEVFRVPGIAVSPGQTTVPSGQLRQFTATVSESSDQRANWSVNGIPGGTVYVGTITQSGLYKAPFVASTVQVRATSVAFPGLFADATVAIVLDTGGLPFNVTVAAPPSTSAFRAGPQDAGGLGFNVTVAKPPSTTAFHAGPQDAGGLGFNVTLGVPPLISTFRPGLQDAGGLGFNVTLGAPAYISSVRQAAGDASGLAPNVTVAQPPDIQAKRP
jgi:YD repeat-containing protein